jgi:hypothetical protein
MVNSPRPNSLYSESRPTNPKPHSDWTTKRVPLTTVNRDPPTPSRIATGPPNGSPSVPQFASAAKVLSDILGTLSKHSTRRTRLTAVRSMTERD